MRRVGISALLLSPLAAGARSAYGHFMESHGYVPGAAWRGAVAARVLQNCPATHRVPGGECDNDECALQAEQQCYFPRLFLDDDGAIFTSLYPTRQEGVRSIPTPLSLHTCKRQGGSKSQQLHKRQTRDLREIARPEAHGLYDLLQPGACPTCPAATCGEGLTAVGSPFMAYGTNIVGTHLWQADATVQTRVALNRRRHTAQDGRLYSVRALERTVGHSPQGQEQWYFSGQLLLPEDLPDSIGQALARLLERGRFNIGGGGSRGLGDVRFTTSDGGWFAEELAQRVQRFQSWHCNRQLTRFALLLTDDAILVDPQTQAPVLGLAAEVVAARLLELGSGPAVASLRAVDGAVCQRAVTISGWNAAWDLPKFSALGTVKGSCAVFEATVAAGTTEYVALVNALSALEEQGIGERRREGLGQVVVCHPVHQKGYEDAYRIGD